MQGTGHTDLPWLPQSLVKLLGWFRAVVTAGGPSPRT